MRIYLSFAFLGHAVAFGGAASASKPIPEILGERYPQVRKQETTFTTTRTYDAFRVSGFNHTLSQGGGLDF
jgi:hypothetical protein